MIVSVTTLGSRGGDAGGAAAAVIDYLDGRVRARGGATPGQMPDLPRLDDGTGRVVGYYADSVEGPGVWVGQGMSGVQPTGVVNAKELRRVLLGQDPASGAQLVGARGSAARAGSHGRHGRAVAAHGPDDELLTLPQAGTLLGVSPQYLRRLAAETAKVEALRGREQAAGNDLTPLPDNHLMATQVGCKAHWRVTRGEVCRFAKARRPPAAVVGYDLTFSVPKSVSILWASSDPARQAHIVAAVNEAVSAGVRYLEANAAYTQSQHRRQGESSREKAGGLVAASYLHATSRALDPQLHCHVVVANMAERPDGTVRALDGRPLYAHAKTAGYLASAELRAQLSRRLGVEWQPVGRGVADVAGVPRAAVVEMSKRSADVEALLEDLTRHLSTQVGERWMTSAQAHQMAAYATRAAKDHAVDPVALRPHWQSRLEAVGLDRRAVEACFDRTVATRAVSVQDREELFAEMASAHGVTELANAFDRRDVIQYVAEWAGDRLSAAEVCDLADAWLATEVVVSLDASLRDRRAGDVIRLAGGATVSAVEGEPLYTTRGMLELEERIAATYERGRHVGAGLVDAEVVEANLAARPRLGADQVAMVRVVTGSGHRIQCVLGPAGSGKTTALEAAARAWEEAGYRPMGAAVQGTAAEVLGQRTGIPSTTVASLLARLDTATDPVLGQRSVVVVDEASTLGNRDLARLASHVERAGATLRLVGDPAQHTAVAAGGGWRHLVEHHREDTPELTELRRQAGPDMADMRQILPRLRQGDIDAALERLRAGERVVEADSPEELLDMVVADWYVDRQKALGDASLEPSSMIAEHHAERRELNARARALLAADGSLSGPELKAGGLDFRVGDEVISVAQERSLRPEGGDRWSFVRNGLRGKVTEVRPGDGPGQEGHVVVDFARRGPVVIPEAYLTKAIRPDVEGVLAHAYALTSHQAQGDTFEAARHLATDCSSLPGLYVGLSRGRSDARMYVVRRRDLHDGADLHTELPRLEDEASAFQALSARLASERSERLASEVDPLARDVAELRHAHTLRELHALAQGEAGDNAHTAARALDDELAAIATRARLEPDGALDERLGPRPEVGTARQAWDRAVDDASRYRALWDGEPVAGGSGATWALGPEPVGPAVDDYRRAAASLHQAEVVLASTRPTPDLARERRQLEGALVLADSQAERDTALAMRAFAAQRLAEAEGDHDWAQRRLQELEAAPRRRRDVEAIEEARRSVDLTEIGRAHV